MSLRTHGDIKATPTSLSVGEVVTVEVKVENTGATAARVRLDVELRSATGLGPAPAETLAFEALRVDVGARKRERVQFTWRAELPPDTPARTYRGALILRDEATGAEVARGALDVYVRAS